MADSDADAVKKKKKAQQDYAARPPTKPRRPAEKATNPKRVVKKEVESDDGAETEVDQRKKSRSRKRSNDRDVAEVSTNFGSVPNSDSPPFLMHVGRTPDVCSRSR